MVWDGPADTKRREIEGSEIGREPLTNFTFHRYDNLSFSVIDVRNHKRGTHSLPLNAQKQPSNIPSFVIINSYRNSILSECESCALHVCTSFYDFSLTIQSFTHINSLNRQRASVCFIHCVLVFMLSRCERMAHGLHVLHIHVG